jgi:hypothetical protein
MIGRLQMICPRPIGTTTNYWSKITRNIACKKWSCPVCGNRMKFAILKRLALNFPKGSDYFFWTLTDHMHPDDISDHFTLFMKNIRKRYKVDKSFWCKEYTPPSHAYRDARGIVRISVGNVKHLHGLTSFIGENPDELEISELWKMASTDSYVVKFEKVILRNPAGYMSKYLTKTFQDSLFMTKEQKYHFSRNCDKLEKPNASVGWSFDTRSQDVIRINELQETRGRYILNTEINEIERHNLKTFKDFKKGVNEHASIK